MKRCNRPPAFTRIELIVILAILGIIIAVVVPAVMNAREAARRARCICHLKQLVLAAHNSHDRHKRFPPSCHVELEPDSEKITAVDGWSWVADFLPELLIWDLAESLDLPDGKPLVEPKDALRGTTPHADALATVIPELICPTYSGSPYADVARTAAITNYKMMGATHIESLDVASPQPTTPKYAPEKEHPDGACFPGSTLKLRDFRFDGTAHTILIVETIEPRFARWGVGAEATLVGLPPIVEYEVSSAGFHAPVGYTEGNHDQQSTVDSSFRTYLDWDYESDPYDGSDGSRNGKFGPSSEHPGVVNHAFVDGSVHSLSSDIDVALYMFLITRNGGDPGVVYED